MDVATQVAKFPSCTVWKNGFTPVNRPPGLTVTHLRRRPWPFRSDTLLLPASALDKVDDENYRALVIDKAQLPYPENQNGSKRLIVESMASVGINVDATDAVVYAPAPGIDVGATTGRTSGVNAPL